MCKLLVVVAGLSVLNFVGVIGCTSDETRQKEEALKGVAQLPEPQPDAAQAALDAKQLERVLSLAAQDIDAGEDDAASGRIESGLELADKFKDEISKGRLLLLRGDLEQSRGKDPEARRYYADATALFHVLKNDEGRVATLVSLASLEMRKGDNAAAGAHLEEAEPLTLALKNPALLARYKEQLGRLSLRKLAHAEASKQLSEAYRFYKDSGDKRHSAEILLFMASADDAQGKDAASRQSLEASAKIYRELFDARGEAQALSRLAAVAERDGRYGQARAFLSKVVEIHTQAGDPGAAAAVVRRMNALPEEN